MLKPWWNCGTERLNGLHNRTFCMQLEHFPSMRCHIFHSPFWLWYQTSQYSRKKLFFILSNTMFTRQFDLPNWTVLTFTQRFVSTNKYFWSICHFVLLPLFIIFGVATAHFYGNYSNGCGWRIFFMDSKINNDFFWMFDLFRKQFVYCLKNQSKYFEMKWCFRVDAFNWAPFFTNSWSFFLGGRCNKTSASAILVNRLLICKLNEIS